MFPEEAVQEKRDREHKNREAAVQFAGSVESDPDAPEWAKNLARAILASNEAGQQ